MMGRATLYCLFALTIISFSALFPFVNICKTVGDVNVNLCKEYTPVWATDLEKTINSVPADKITVLSGSAATKVIGWQSEKRIFQVNADTPSIIRIRTFYYPGWEARIDEIKAGVEIQKNSGAMLVSVPKGEHLIELAFADTPLRRFAMYLSACSCLLLALFAMGSIKSHHTLRVSKNP
jgi:uncharacterized membrane protein YfhO